jgi:hypothetical protein
MDECRMVEPTRGLGSDDLKEVSRTQPFPSMQREETLQLGAPPSQDTWSCYRINEQIARGKPVHEIATTADKRTENNHKTAQLTGQINSRFHKKDSRDTWQSI